MKCGTRHGWDAHKARNEPPCKWCIKAVTAPAPVVRAKPGPKRRPKVNRPESPTAEHGTNAGYGRHKSRGEQPCRDCQDAQNAYARSRYKPRPRKEVVCGTEPGRAKHKREGTPVCNPCREAYNRRARERHAQKRG